MNTVYGIYNELCQYFVRYIHGSTYIFRALYSWWHWSYVSYAISMAIWSLCHQEKTSYSHGHSVRNIRAVPPWIQCTEYITNCVNILYATFMAVLIYFVHYIHGGTDLMFRTLYPWLYEVFAIRRRLHIAMDIAYEI